MGPRVLINGIWYNTSTGRSKEPPTKLTRPQRVVRVSQLPAFACLAVTRDDLQKRHDRIGELSPELMVLLDCYNRLYEVALLTREALLHLQVKAWEEQVKAEAKAKAEHKDA